MRFYIVRPFDLATRFWTYKITINDQEFLFKGIGTMPVDVTPSDNYTINVSTQDEDENDRRSNQPITLTSRELPKNSRIIIRSNVTNLRLIIMILAGILGFLLMIFMEDIFSIETFVPSWITGGGALVAPWLFQRLFRVDKENYFTIIIDKDSPPIWNEK